MSTYNSPVDVQPVTLVRSSNINDLDAAVAEAFGFLPDETLLKQGKHLYAVDTGTANTHLVSLPVSPGSYVDGLSFTFKAKTSNTAACTVNVNSLGVVAISREDGTDLVVGDIVAGQMCTVRYNITTSKFQLGGTNAASSAVAAAASAATATTQAGIATTQAGISTTKASEAAASAATATNAPATNTVSSTSLTIGTGSKSLTVQSGKAIVVGMSVKIANTASPTNWMHGDVTAYDSSSGALTVNVSSTNGSGTASTWTISLSGVQGSSAAPPALILISTASASNVATVDFTSSIDTTYDTYMFTYSKVVPSTDNARLQLLTSSNGGSSFDTGATDYLYANSYASSNAGHAASVSGSANSMYLTPLGANGVESSSSLGGVSGVMYIHRTSGANYTRMTFHSHFSEFSGWVCNCVGGGARKSTTAANAIRFLFSTGNIASGEFKLYGLKKL